MVKQDYIMRLIQEMVRAILKLVFHIDTDSPTAELLEESEDRETLESLIHMVDAGKIDEAENRIYEMTEYLNQSDLKIALLFYAHLNGKSDDFLEENNFSRDEVQQGLSALASRYGFDSIKEMFLE